jgi:hypothetical protein
MKYKIHQSILIATIIAFISSSCIGGRDYGPLEKQYREVRGFDRIEVSHGIDVSLTMGSKEQLEISAPEDLLEHLVTEVKGGSLKIYYDRSFNWNNNTKVYLTARKLEGINTSGGSDLTGENVLKSKNLDLKASGGSDIRLEVSVKNLDVHLSGGADITLIGEAERLRADSSGGGDLKAFGLVVQEADLESSGGSDIRITVEEELVARASGGSDIEYRGNPRILDTNTSSSADISKRE